MRHVEPVRMPYDQGLGDGPSGFTLIEVIVTLTILGFILLIISGAFRLGLSAWDRGEETREVYQRQRTVTQLVTRQVKSAVPYKIKTEKAEGDYLAFEGKENGLKFVSTLSLRAGRPEGFVFAIYEFKAGGQEGGRLVVHEKKVINKDFFEEGPKDEGVSVLEGLSDVRFEYFREEDKEKTRPEAWLTEWNAKDENELPKAMRMTFTFTNGKEGKEEAPLTLLASLSSNRFDEIRTSVGPVGPRFRNRAVQQQLQQN